MILKHLDEFSTGPTLSIQKISFMLKGTELALWSQRLIHPFKVGGGLFEHSRPDSACLGSQCSKLWVFSLRVAKTTQLRLQNSTVCYSRKWNQFGSNTTHWKYFRIKSGQKYVIRNTNVNHYLVFVAWVLVEVWFLVAWVEDEVWFVMAWVEEDDLRKTRHIS